MCLIGHLCKAYPEWRTKQIRGTPIGEVIAYKREEYIDSLLIKVIVTGG